VLQVETVSRLALLTAKCVLTYLQKVNEKPQVINDYEAGRGIPNQVVIGKIERAIGKWVTVQSGLRTDKNNSTVGHLRQLISNVFSFLLF
jgi:hypothetical protein